MDKFELKNLLINVHDELYKMGGDLMSNDCRDEETGKLRAEALSALINSTDKIKEIIYKIY